MGEGGGGDIGVCGVLMLADISCGISVMRYYSKLRDAFPNCFSQRFSQYQKVIVRNNTHSKNSASSLVESTSINPKQCRKSKLSAKS